MEDYKEKYEQAMLRMNKWVEGSEITDPKEVAEFIFPELKESEDLKIKRDIQYAVRCAYGDNSNNTNSILAWLEKQGKKPNMPQDTEDGLRRQSTIQILEYARSLDAYNQYGKESINKNIAWLKKQGEQKPAWSREDSSCYDDICEILINLIYSPKSNVNKDVVQRDLNWIMSIKEKICPQNKQNCNNPIEINRRLLKKNEVKVGDIITYFRDGKKGIMLVSSFDAGIYPRCKWGITHIDGTAYSDWNPGYIEYYAATEEEKQQLYNTMPEYVKDWLKSIKERVQPKQEWSEEDEKMWITISDLLWEGFKLSDGKVSWDKIRCWLLPKIKSLKERLKGE